MQIFYSGRVQGVGFRYTAKTVAAGFEISGIVRNLSDGRVELIAEGDARRAGSLPRGHSRRGAEAFHPRRKCDVERRAK